MTDLEAIKRHNCIIKYKFSYIPVHVHREELRKYTLEDTSRGRKSYRGPQRILEIIEDEKAGSSREVAPLIKEGKLEDPYLNLQRLNTKSRTLRPWKMPCRRRNITF